MLYPCLLPSFLFIRNSFRTLFALVRNLCYVHRGCIATCNIFPLLKISQRKYVTSSNKTSEYVTIADAKGKESPKNILNLYL